ncbi:MAG: winged helix-turn-helix domain-containing protein [Thaumarchaeota archaeon]|nr:winged helix-turn-helix domain-containing protein [Nitrososphaerota archaeon]
MKSQCISRTYRDQIEIIENILTKTGNGCRKTRIMYAANLSSSQMRRYLTLLVDAKCLLYEPEERLFMMSPKGSELLQAIHEISRAKENLHRSKEKLRSLIDIRTLADIDSE